MNNLDTAFSIVNQRHEELRAMARRAPNHHDAITPRLLLGRSVVQIGRWIEGQQHRPALSAVVDRASHLTSSRHQRLGG